MLSKISTVNDNRLKRKQILLRFFIAVLVAVGLLVIVVDIPDTCRYFEALNNIEKQGEIGYIPSEQQSLWQKSAGLVLDKRLVLPIHRICFWGEVSSHEEFLYLVRKSEPTLRELDFADLHWNGPEPIEVGYLPRLEALTLSLWKLEAVFPIRIDAPNIQHLRLCDFSDFHPHLISTGGLSSVKKLQIDGKITTEELETLHMFPELEKIHFTSFSPDFVMPSEIVGNGVVSFPSLPKVQVIFMPVVVGKTITAFDLSPLPKLKAVHFVWSGITDDVLGHSTFPENLETLSISFSINSSAAFKRLGRFPQLKSLQISQTTMDDGIFEIMDNFPELRELSLEAVSDTTGRTLRELVTAEQLTKLTLRAAMDKNAMERLPVLPELQSLDLTFVNITESAIDRIFALPKLEELFVAESHISEAGINRILQTKRIKVWVLRSGEYKLERF